MAIERALHSGCAFFIQGGIEPADLSAQRRLAARYPGRVGLALGLHPEWVAAATYEQVQAALAEFERELETAQDISCLGELGLHFGREGGGPGELRQEQVFRQALTLIRDAGRPEAIILHGVRAQARMLAIWDEVFTQPRAGMVHSYSGSFEGAKEWIERGLLISPRPGVARSGYQTLKKAMARLPLESLTFESDCPDQSPVRDTDPQALGEPTDVLAVARAVAVLRGLDPEQGLALLLSQSSKNLARIGIRGLPPATP